MGSYHLLSALGLFFCSSSFFIRCIVTGFPFQIGSILIPAVRWRPWKGAKEAEPGEAKWT